MQKYHLQHQFIAKPDLLTYSSINVPMEIIETFPIPEIH